MSNPGRWLGSLMETAYRTNTAIPLQICQCETSIYTNNTMQSSTLHCCSAPLKPLNTSYKAKGTDWLVALGKRQTTTRTGLLFQWFYQNDERIGALAPKRPHCFQCSSFSPRLCSWEWKDEKLSRSTHLPTSSFIKKGNNAQQNTLTASLQQVRTSSLVNNLWLFIDILTKKSTNIKNMLSPPEHWTPTEILLCLHNGLISINRNLQLTVTCSSVEHFLVWV